MLSLCSALQHQVSSHCPPPDSLHVSHPPDISSNGTLEFEEIRSHSRMNLVGKDKISVSCTGPYVLYMYLCYKSLQVTEARGSLQLQVVGKKNPVSTFNLTALQEVCNGHHSIAYLKQGEEASLYLSVKDRFKVKNVTVGLWYLLGRKCDYWGGPVNALWRKKTTGKRTQHSSTTVRTDTLSRTRIGGMTCWHFDHHLNQGSFASGITVSSNLSNLYITIGKEDFGGGDPQLLYL